MSIPKLPGRRGHPPGTRARGMAAALRTLKEYPNDWMWIEESWGMALVRAGEAIVIGKRGERQFKYRGLSRHPSHNKRRRLEGMSDVKPDIPTIPRGGC